MSHTPGPWNVCRDRRDGHTVIRDETGFAICSEWHFLTEHSKANARLIAAAPDLLQELRNIANADYRHWEDGHNTAEEFVLWAKSRARHAISKAEGVKP